MAEVERSGDGYRVTLTAEEAAAWLDYTHDPNSVDGPHHPAEAIAWDVADGLRACKPPPPPQPGDVVWDMSDCCGDHQFQVIAIHGDYAWLTKSTNYRNGGSGLIEWPKPGNVKAVASLQVVPQDRREVLDELRRDVRVGGDQ